MKEDMASGIPRKAPRPSSVSKATAEGKNVTPPKTVRTSKSAIDMLLSPKVSESTATAMANKLLSKAKLEDKVGEKLKARASDIIVEVVTHLTPIFNGLMTISGSGTEATVNFKEEVVEALYRTDVLEYRSQIEIGKSLNLFEIYYGPLREAGHYKNAVHSITNRGSDLDMKSVKKMTKDSYSISALVFWALHTINDYVKNQGVEISSLDFKGVVPIYSVMDYLKREKPPLMVGDGMQHYGGLFKNCKIESTFSGPVFVVDLTNYVFHSGNVVKTGTSVSIPLRNHMVNKDLLPFHVPTDKETAALQERGKKYFKYASNASYLSCNGPGYRRTYWSMRSYNCVGRVMIDAASMVKADPNYSKFFGISDRYGGFKQNEEELKFDESTLSNEILFSASPYVYGFSMKSKQWVEIPVESLSDIKFVENAFDDLVLDGRIKDIIRSLVEADSISYTDIITNKGLGYIFLLSGGPGVGN